MYTLLCYLENLYIKELTCIIINKHLVYKEGQNELNLTCKIGIFNALQFVKSFENSLLSSLLGLKKL